MHVISGHCTWYWWGMNIQISRLQLYYIMYIALYTAQLAVLLAQYPSDNVMLDGAINIAEITVVSGRHKFAL